MVPDKFGRSTIRNLYFDTDDHILARHSIAKPDFKEKLRIRSYSAATSETTVFVELKRKADHLVYKRRIPLPEEVAMSWTQRLAGKAGFDGYYTGSFADADKAQSPVSAQMTREIDYFLSYYGNLKPAVFLSYDRQAYRMKRSAAPQDRDFRVTFDENILFRDYDLSLRSDVYGTPILDEDKVLMEIKCSGGIPLWMAEVLSSEHIYKTSFSKYGMAYSKYIQPEQLRKEVTARQDRAAESVSEAAVQAGQMSDHYGSDRKTAGSMFRLKNDRKRRKQNQKSGKHSRTAAIFPHFMGI